MGQLLDQVAGRESRLEDPNRSKGRREGIGCESDGVLGNQKILRAILQTSDDEDDVALGVAGSGISIDVNWGTHRLSIAANNALRNLSLNQREADVFIGSGLFGEIEVDFSQRLEYLESNGVRPIGMSVFAKGSDLSAWLKKYDMKLVDAQADGE